MKPSLSPTSNPTHAVTTTSGLQKCFAALDATTSEISSDDFDTFTAEGRYPIWMNETDKLGEFGVFLKANATCNQLFPGEQRGSLAVFENPNDATDFGNACSTSQCMVGYHDAVGSDYGGTQWVDVFGNQVNLDGSWLQLELSPDFTISFPRHFDPNRFCTTALSSGVYLGKLLDNLCSNQVPVCQYFNSSCTGS